jgi:hypothetical protein
MSLTQYDDPVLSGLGDSRRVVGKPCFTKLGRSCPSIGNNSAAGGFAYPFLDFFAKAASAKSTVR